MVEQRSLQENQEQLQEEYVPYLEKDLRQRRKIGRHGSERARQRSDVPKIQCCERYEDDERQDHNTDTPFEFRHSQENNKALTEAQVCYAHVAKKNETSRTKGAGDPKRRSYGV